MFLSQYGQIGESAFQTWCLGLAGFTPIQIKKGFGRFLTSDKKGPPSLKEFQDFCRPTLQEFGLKGVREAYEEACFTSVKGVWSHPAVYAAASNTGFFTLRNEPQAKSYPIFKEEYDKICKRVMDGDDFSKSLPNQRKQDDEKETPLTNSKEKMQELKNKLGIGERYVD